MATASLRGIIPLLVAVVLNLSPSAHAAACCTSATAFGTGRLLLWESWASGLRFNATHELGFFDDTGMYEHNEPGVIDQRFRLDAYSIVGLSEDASIFIVVPWLVPRIALNNQIHLGSNISDLQVGYRHQIIAIGEYEELPSLAFTGSLLIPTGTSRGKNVPPQDVTGRGTWVLMAGASLEKTWMPYFLQLNLGSSLLITDSIDAAFQIALASGVELTSDLVLSLMGQWIYEAPAKYKFEAGTSLSWRFTPHFTAQLNLNTDVFVNGLGANWPGTLAYGFGLRYGYF